MKRKELLLLGEGETPKAKKKQRSSKANQINGELLIPCRCTQQKKKKSVSPIHLPEEIVMDILSRLPVQSLQRFKCVSPFWCTLISDRHFIKRHLNYAKNDLNSQKLLSANYPFRRSKIAFYRSSLSSSSIQVIEDDEQRLDRPPNCKPSCTIRCSCDGLVLLSSYDSSANLTHLLLWNPSTRESILLPSQEYAVRYWVFGLGYDATSDDYKILVADLNGDSKQLSVEILSLKSGSWRKIGGKYPTGMRRVSGFSSWGLYPLAFINGAFHWLGKSAACYTIISFNISNEVYGEIPLLEHMYNMVTYRFDHGVSALRGMLSYYNLPDAYNLTYNYKLWVMKDYGVKESWIPLHKIRDTRGLGSAVPRYMFADDDVLLHLKKYVGPSKSLFWTSKRGQFDLWPESRRIIVYTESLISPKLLI